MRLLQLGPHSVGLDAPVVHHLCPPRGGRVPSRPDGRDVRCRLDAAACGEASLQVGARALHAPGRDTAPVRDGAEALQQCGSSGADGSVHRPGDEHSHQEAGVRWGTGAASRQFECIACRCSICNERGAVWKDCLQTVINILHDWLVRCEHAGGRRTPASFACLRFEVGE